MEKERGLLQEEGTTPGVFGKGKGNGIKIGGGWIKVSCRVH